MGHYRKQIKAGSFEDQFYKAMGFPPLADVDGIPLILRITLGDMDILDGFYISLPLEAERLSIEDTIRKFVLCETVKTEVIEKISKISNLDLLDIYKVLLDIYRDFDDGKIGINYHINNGSSYIKPSDAISMHQQMYSSDDGIQYNLLDVVLDIYENINPFSEIADAQRDAMLDEFKGIFILYLMDKFDYNAEYSITPKGYNYLNRIIVEAEFYIYNYDIFGDVYVKSSGEIMFNTGYGENLIIPVFKKEGIEPYRAIFIVAMYLGNLDWMASDPFFSEEAFQEIFELMVLSPEVEEKVLDSIIREGKLKIEEQKLREERARYIENIERYIQ